MDGFGARCDDLVKRDVCARERLLISCVHASSAMARALQQRALRVLHRRSSCSCSFLINQMIIALLNQLSYLNHLVI